MKRRKFITSAGVASGAFILGTGTGIGCKPFDRRRSPRSVPFDFPDLQPPGFVDQTFDIRDHGAKPGGDTSFMNTGAIREAINACNQAGGGRVLVPPGVWLTGPVHLRSNVNLHLEEGAELRFSQRFEDYLPVVLIQRGGAFCYNYSPPVYAIKCENIAVTGTGLLNGQGQVWWPFAAFRFLQARHAYNYHVKAVRSAGR